MSNSQPSVQNSKFLAAASLIIVLTAGLAASAWPAVLSYDRAQSVILAAAGERAAGDESRLDYRLAYLLDQDNEAAAISVASAEQEAGDSVMALKSLKNAGNSRGADRVRVKAALETGDTTLAQTAAARLAAPGATDADLTLVALADGVVGKPERIEGLKTRITSPEALQGVLRASGSKVTLAVALLATGLPLSSRSILETAEVSVPRNLLLANLIKNDGRAADLPSLANLYRQAIKIDPTSTVARGELVAVLQEQKDDSGVVTEQKLLNRLNAGRP